MLSLGGLYDKSEVKLLTLYILANLGRPLTLQELSDTILSEGLCDYFTVSEGVRDLVLSGHIIEDIQDMNLYITDLGSQTSGQLSSTLPFTVREKALTAAYLCVAAMDRDAQITCDVLRNGEEYKLVMGISDLNTPVMELSLSVPNEAQAKKMKKRFKDNAEQIYQHIIELLAK